MFLYTWLHNKYSVSVRLYFCLFIDRCHTKSGTSIFRHPCTANTRIFGTPIPIFLGIRDTTTSFRKNGTPSNTKRHRSRSVRRNASSYQESFSGEIKRCCVKMIYHAARERIGDGAKLSQRLRGRAMQRSGLMTGLSSTWCAGNTQKERPNRRRLSFESEPSISDRRMGSFFVRARTAIKRKSICVLWSGTRSLENRFLRAAMWDQQGIMKGETEPMRRSRRSTTGLEWPKMWSSG